MRHNLRGWEDGPRSRQMPKLQHVSCNMGMDGNWLLHLLCASSVPIYRSSSLGVAWPEVVPVNVGPGALGTCRCANRQAQHAGAAKFLDGSLTEVAWLPSIPSSHSTCMYYIVVVL